MFSLLHQNSLVIYWPCFQRLGREYRRGAFDFWEQMVDRFPRLARLVAIVPIVWRRVHCLLCCYCDNAAPLSFYIVFIRPTFHLRPQTLTVSACQRLYLKKVCGLWLPPAVGSWALPSESTRGICLSDSSSSIQMKMCRWGFRCDRSVPSPQPSPGGESSGRSGFPGQVSADCWRDGNPAWGSRRTYYRGNRQ